MDAGETNSQASGNSTNQCLPRSNCNQVRIVQYEKELRDVSDYVETRRTEINTKSTNFKERGLLRRFWDAKVPEKEKTFYNFFSFDTTNPVEVSTAIQKYVDFYDEMGSLVTKICTTDENEGEEENNQNENVVYHSLVSDLGRTANELFIKAIKEKNSTNSSEICKLHSLFLTKHEELERMLKDTENTALKRDLTRATKGWIESKKAINTLTEKVESLEEKINMLIQRFGDFPGS